MLINLQTRYPSSTFYEGFQHPPILYTKRCYINFMAQYVWGKVGARRVCYRRVWQAHLLSKDYLIIKYGIVIHGFIITLKINSILFNFELKFDFPWLLESYCVFKNWQRDIFGGCWAFIIFWTSGTALDHEAIGMICFPLNCLQFNIEINSPSSIQNDVSHRLIFPLLLWMEMGYATHFKFVVLVQIAIYWNISNLFWICVSRKQCLFLLDSLRCWQSLK